MKICEYYFGDWTCRRDIEDDFDNVMSLDNSVFVAGERYLVTNDTYTSYSDRSVVLYIDYLYDIYIVDAEECSCLGLEYQWLPSKITKEYLMLKVKTDCALKVEKAALTFLEILEHEGDA